MPESPPFWRSLEELQRKPAFREFVAREFGEDAFAPLDRVGRRRFLQLMGASMALAGCRWEEDRVVPLTRRPAGHVPGKAKPYMTTLDSGGHGVGVEVSVVDGRPIKIDGNPAHPTTRGAISASLGARILELYDPERSHDFAHGGPKGMTRASRDGFLKALRTARAKAKGDGGARLAVVADTTSSPTWARLRRELAEQLPKMVWHDFAPRGQAREEEGIASVFGAPLRATLVPDAAKVIVSLEGDLLGTHPTALANLRGWAAGRSPEGKQDNRLYVLESAMSLTGMNADHRLPLPSRDVSRMAIALAVRVGEALETPAPWSMPDGVDKGWLEVLTDELVKHRGRSLLAAGETQPAAVHAVVAWLHHTLGSIGTTVRYLRPPEAPPSHTLQRITKAAQDGALDTLIVLGCNPVYEAPGDVAFASAMQAVPERFVASLYTDATARLATWHAPLAHPLACWGDARAFDGTWGIQQPLIEPLFGGMNPIALLAELAGQRDAAPQSLVRVTFDEAHRSPAAAAAKNALPVVLPSPSERAWRQALSEGLVAGTQFDQAKPTPGANPATLPDEPNGADAIELTFFDDGKLEGGRLANNAWLQETPESRTKLVWDNALLVGPATAKTLGVDHEDVVTVKTAGGHVELPVYIMPGQARGTASVAIGYGRKHAGTVGGLDGEGIRVGVDVAPLRTSAAPWRTTASITRTGKRATLATTQDHHAIDALGSEERERRSHHLVRQVSREALEKDPKAIRSMDHHPPLESLWERRDEDGHQWGLSIDLSRCVGCNACMVACQSENNVPVVGKEQVLKGREMHWLRIDRYFQGDPEAPRVAQQPLACAHCESAPCEQVCPVGATMHSREGLNDMVYNRCIGTRYCANNCPYKVRRFNFLDYHDDLDQGGESHKRVRLMVHNPDVTVRERGVMEKCTYCVQRIQGAKRQARIEGRPVRDGDITTACAQACPTQAIVFGDLADPKSRVSKQQALLRSYALLEELNIRPRTRYLARVTNENPKLERGAEAPKHG